MKKIIVNAMLSFVVGFGLFAGYDDSLYFMRRTGQDFYADGSPVADGEFYAVVFQTPDADFRGFKQDGSLESTNGCWLVAMLPFAENGRCRPFLLQADKRIEAAWPPGTYCLYMLDTRASWQGGSYRLAPTLDGFPTQVRSASLVGTASRTGQANSMVAVEQKTYTVSAGAVPIDMSRAIDVTNVVVQTVFETNVLTRTLFETNTVVQTLFKTNFVEQIAYGERIVETVVVATNYIDEISREATPVDGSKKTLYYSGRVLDVDGNDVGSVRIKVGSPNSYNVVRASASFKLTDSSGRKPKTKSYSRPLYGMVDDYGAVDQNFQKLVGKVLYRGEEAAGWVKINGKEYVFECRLEK